MRSNFILFILFLLLGACTSRPQYLNGKAQGTTFNIRYYGEIIPGDADSIATIFHEMDRCFSLWLKESELNKINACTDDSCLIDDSNGHFKALMSLSKNIYNNTNGDFNPALHPIIKAWGFGLEEKRIPDSLRIDSILENTDFSHWVMKDSYIHKAPNGTLDLNAIAQGYTIDVISKWFLDQGISNYFIEVGGEIRTSGTKPGNKKWTVGMEKPAFDGSRSNVDTLYLQNASMATSGNYRKYYEIEGRKYSHTLDPSTGYPVDHQLLSVTVIAPDCASADAYATAFMVKGKEETLVFLENNEHLKLEVYLISDDMGKLDMYHTEGFKRYLQN